MAEHSSGMTWGKYWGIFIILMVLLVATVAVAYVHIPSPFAVIVAMTIAVVKAVLVVLYFMHVRYNSKLTWLFVISGFVWLIIMIGITLTDYKTRDWDKGGYSAKDDVYSSPYGVPATMFPQNMGETSEGHGDDHSNEAATEEHGTEEGSGH